MSGSLDAIMPPEKLSATHDLSDFDSGEPVLDEWLRRRALHNEAHGSPRTYVVCVGKTVVGTTRLLLARWCMRTRQGW